MANPPQDDQPAQSELALGGEPTVDELTADATPQPSVQVTRPRRVRSRAADSEVVDPDEAEEDIDGSEDGGRISYTAVLLTQGKHRFYTLSMPSDVLAETCIVEPRDENPLEGFQRSLDEKRAQDIARYIDSGFGTIPSSIVLSAQSSADLEYRRKARTLSFAKTGKSFLILDGQHRVYGFKLATSKLRVPVVIYNGLSRTEECRLFMDINTKQRPVPNELLLDIKRMAETESGAEALLRDVFDAFDKDTRSPLLGLMSPSERRKGRISRVTFNAALKPITDSFSGAEASYVYDVLSGYVHAYKSAMRDIGLEEAITNPTIFRALMLLFPIIAERVNDRHPGEFTVAHFDELVSPLFQRMKKSDLERPGTSYVNLHELFNKALKSGFTIGRGPAS